MNLFNDKEVVIEVRSGNIEFETSVLFYKDGKRFQYDLKNCLYTVSSKTIINYKDHDWYSHYETTYLTYNDYMKNFLDNAEEEIIIKVFETMLKGIDITICDVLKEHLSDNVLFYLETKGLI